MSFLRKYASHYTKYLLRRDTLFATISVFLVLILLGLIPINFYVLNPMKMALKDFDFNDIAYAKLEKGKSNPIDSNIVIVNIGDGERAELSLIIDAVSKYQPSAIGLDAYFNEPREEVSDSMLRHSIISTPNLVMASRLGADGEKLFVRKDHFESSHVHEGYANLAAEEIGTVRYYSPFENLGDTIYPHFTSKIVGLHNKNSLKVLKQRQKEVETINYSRRREQYLVISKEDLLLGEVDSSIFKNRIVLLGYVSDDEHDIEDKKFTPMNKKVAGKQLPDMNGVIVQANIISMVLEENYVTKMPKWASWLIAILIGWVHMSLFIRYYLDDHIWFHLVAKLVQVISAIFFAYVGIFLFDQFRLKIEMKYTLYVIILAVDIIYFYEALAVWMNKKFGFRTVFHHHHAH